MQQFMGEEDLHSVSWQGTVHELGHLSVSRQHGMEQFMDKTDFLFHDSMEWNNLRTNRAPCISEQACLFKDSMEWSSFRKQHVMEQFIN